MQLSKAIQLRYLGCKMGQWISSKEFAESGNIGIQGLLKAIKRYSSMNKKICQVKGKILPFKYIDGIGRGGKILQIWSKPLSKEEASLIEQGFSIEDISTDNTHHSYIGKLKTNSNTLVKQPLGGGLAKELNNREYREEIAVWLFSLH